MMSVKFFIVSSYSNRNEIKEINYLMHLENINDVENAIKYIENRLPEIKTNDHKFTKPIEISSNLVYLNEEYFKIVDYKTSHRYRNIDFLITKKENKSYKIENIKNAKISDICIDNLSSSMMGIHIINGTTINIDDLKTIDKKISLDIFNPDISFSIYNVIENKYIDFSTYKELMKRLDVVLIFHSDLTLEYIKNTLQKIYYTINDIERNVKLFIYYIDSDGDMYSMHIGHIIAIRKVEKIWI